MHLKRWMCLVLALVMTGMLPAGAVAASKAAIKLPAKVGIIYVGQEVQLKAKTKGVKADSLKYEPSAQGVVRLKVPVGVRLSPSLVLSMPFLPT